MSLKKQVEACGKYLSAKSHKEKSEREQGREERKLTRILVAVLALIEQMQLESIARLGSRRAASKRQELSKGNQSRFERASTNSRGNRTMACSFGVNSARISQKFCTSGSVGFSAE